MFQEIFQKFEQLPQEERQYLSSPLVLERLEEIEEKFGVKLALALMDIAVNKVTAEELPSFLEGYLLVGEETARQIADQLSGKILREYWEMAKESKASHDNLLPSKDLKETELTVRPVSRQELVKAEGKVQTISSLRHPETVFSLRHPETAEGGTQDPEILNQVQYDRKHLNQTQGDRKEEGDYASETVFSPDDEEEIEEIKKALNSKEVGSWKKGDFIDWQKEAENVIMELDIHLTDDLLKKRLVNVVASALRGVRSVFDLKETLQKSREEGGVELGGEATAKIVDKVSERRKQIERGTFVPSEGGLKKENEQEESQGVHIEREKVTAETKDDKGDKKGFLGGLSEEDLQKFFSNSSQPTEEPTDKPEDKEERATYEVPQEPKDPKESPKEKTAFSVDKKEEKSSLASDEVPEPLNGSSVYLKQEPGQEEQAEGQNLSEEEMPIKEETDESKDEEIGTSDKGELPQEDDFSGQKEEEKEGKKGSKEEAVSSAQNKQQEGQEPPSVSRSPAEEVEKQVSIEKRSSILDRSLREITPPQGTAKEESRLTGPFQEIESITVGDLRRWSQDPHESAQKIADKISLLAQEGLDKGVLAIKSWKKSPLYRLYLDILNDAFIKKKPVAQIIEEREKEHKESLSPEEFEAVAQLNEKLRI